MRVRYFLIPLGALLVLLGMIPSASTDTTSPPTYQHSAKFVCGRSNFAASNGPVLAGEYATAINVHNPNFTTVAGASYVPAGTRGFSSSFSTTFRKKALVLYPQATTDPASPPETAQRPGPWIRPDSLASDYGFEIDCSDIRNVLLGDISPEEGSQPDPRAADDNLIKGYVVIEARAPLPLDVVVAYTGFTINSTAGTESREGFSEEIETVQPKRIR
jgi:hypothetical protein